METFLPSKYGPPLCWSWSSLERAPKNTRNSQYAMTMCWWSKGIAIWYDILNIWCSNASIGFKKQLREVGVEVPQCDYGKLTASSLFSSSKSNQDLKAIEIWFDQTDQSFQLFQASLCFFSKSGDGKIIFLPLCGCYSVEVHALARSLQRLWNQTEQINLHRAKTSNSLMWVHLVCLLMFIVSQLGFVIWLFALATSCRHLWLWPTVFPCFSKNSQATLAEHRSLSTHFPLHCKCFWRSTSLDGSKLPCKCHSTWTNQKGDAVLRRIQGPNETKRTKQNNQQQSDETNISAALQNIANILQDGSRFCNCHSFLSIKAGIRPLGFSEKLLTFAHPKSTKVAHPFWVRGLPRFCKLRLTDVPKRKSQRCMQGPKDVSRKQNKQTRRLQIRQNCWITWAMRAPGLRSGVQCTSSQIPRFLWVFQKGSLKPEQAHHHQASGTVEWDFN